MTTMTIDRPKPAVTGYDPEIRFYASRFTQGGRTVYSLDLSLAQIAGLLPAPDPLNPQPGNRRIVPAHATAFGAYVRGTAEWFSPGISLRGTEEFDFDVTDSVGGTEVGIVSLPFMALNDIHIIDGQHRILGIHTALRQITADIEKARALYARVSKRKVPEDDAEDHQAHLDALQRHLDTLVEQRARFETERIQIQLVIEDDQIAYQQMFFDAADNQMGITASVKARFDARKPVNRVLQEALDHPLLAGRVDLEADRLGKANPNLLSAKHVAEIIRILAVGIGGRMGKRIEQNLDENALAERTVAFLDLLTELDPYPAMLSGELTPAEVRNTTMIGSPVMLRVLAGVYRNLEDQPDKLGALFGRLNKHLAKPATKQWVSRTGDLFTVGALSPLSRRQDLVELTNRLTDWAENPPEWLSK